VDIFIARGLIDLLPVLFVDEKALVNEITSEWTSEPGFVDNSRQKDK
jgi:hypothetical protein